MRGKVITFTHTELNPPDSFPGGVLTFGTRGVFPYYDIVGFGTGSIQINYFAQAGSPNVTMIKSGSGQGWTSDSYVINVLHDFLITEKSLYKHSDGYWGWDYTLLED